MNQASEIFQIADTLSQTSKKIDTKEFLQLLEAAEEVGKAWSRSWLVYGGVGSCNATYAQFSRLSLVLSQPATDGGIVHAKVFSDLAQCVSVVSVC